MPCSVRLLASDYAVDCDSEAYRRVQASSFAFIVAYGIGIPLAFNLLGLFLNRSSPPPPQ